MRKNVGFMKLFISNFLFVRPRDEISKNSSFSVLREIMGLLLETAFEICLKFLKKSEVLKTKIPLPILESL